MEDKVKKQWIVLEDEEEIVLNTVNGRKNKAKEQLLDSVLFSLWGMNMIYDYLNTFFFL